MKKLLTNNVGYKLLSFGVAILLWIIVVNNENPMITKSFSNIPVVVTNEEIVTNKGNTYQILEDTVSVTITAQRSVMSELGASKIKAVADMTNLDPYSGTLIPVDVFVPGYQVSSAEASPRNIQVKIEMESTKTFPIIAKSNGTPRDGHVVGELSVEPKEIEISGPESLVDSIAQVVAEVNVAGISKNETKKTDVVFYDENNAVINTTLLRNNLGDEGVKVKVSVFQSRTVPLEIDTSAIKAASGYIFEGITVEPEVVEVVGPVSELDVLESVYIPANALQFSNLKKSEQVTIDIKSYLPDWAIQPTENTSIPVIVKINVTKEGTRTIEYATGAISIVNVPKGYKVDYGNITSIELVIKGEDEELEKLELSQGSVSINLIDIKEEGTYTVPVNVVLPGKLEMNDDIKIKIVVSKLSEE